MRLLYTQTRSNAGGRRPPHDATCATPQQERITASTTDAEKGVADGFRAMPMSPVAKVAGSCTWDMLYTLLVLAIPLVRGWNEGWQWRYGVGNAHRFGSPGAGNTLMADNAILLATFWPALIVAIFAPLSVDQHRRLSR